MYDSMLIMVFLDNEVIGGTKISGDLGTKPCAKLCIY